MNNLDGKDLLPDSSALSFGGIEQDSDGWVVHACAQLWPLAPTAESPHQPGTAVTGVS